MSESNPTELTADEIPVQPPSDVFAELSPEVARVYKRNFVATVLYSIFTRVGWIYKTESTIIPGFVTALTSNPLIIGLIPLISRGGQYLPQFLVLNRVERAPRKKPVFIAIMGVFTVAWGVMSWILWYGQGASPTFLLVTFFLLYGLSWMCMGVTRILERVLQGRLIPTRRRGRIFAVSGPLGSYSVILSGPVIAYVLGGGAPFPRDYAIVFGFGFLFFIVAFAGLFLIAEPPETRKEMERQNHFEIARDGWRLFRESRDFRLIFLLACIQSVTMYLFSFYVAYARTWSADAEFQRHLNATFGWGLSVQNVVIGTLALFLGMLVDWKGNRVVLRGLCLMLSNVPLLAVIIGRTVGLEHRLTALLGVYALIGGGPVLLRVMDNYLLEVSPGERQALYVGIFGSGQMVTLAFPLLIGNLVNLLRGWLGEKEAYEAVFLLCAGVLYLSVLVAWRLREPRRHPASGKP